MPWLVAYGDSDEARVLRPLQAAACTYPIAFGPLAGQTVLTVQGAIPKNADFKQHLCAETDGFSLHADVRCDADDRQALEQLHRYRGTSSEGLVTDRTGRFRAAISEPRMSVQGRQRQCGRINS